MSLNYKGSMLYPMASIGKYSPTPIKCQNILFKIYGPHKRQDGRTNTEVIKIEGERCHDQPPGTLLRNGRGSQSLSLDPFFELCEERPTFLIFASLMSLFVNNPCRNY